MLLRRPTRPPAPPPVARQLASRAVGLEAEHAIVLVPRGGPRGGRPTRRELYELVEEQITARLPVLPSGQHKRGIFLPSGGLIQYEALPSREHEGLVETATPECRDPLEVTLHHRALEDLLADTVPAVERILQDQDTPADLILGKNALDYRGNHFGTHENYEVEDRRPGWQRPLELAALLVAWVPLALPLALAILVGLGVLAVGAAVGAAVLLLDLASLLPLVGRRVRRARQRLVEVLRRVGGRLADVGKWLVDRASVGLVRLWGWLLGLCLRPCFLRPYQRDLPGFLVTRTLFCGAGMVADDGTLHLSQRAQVLGPVAGIYIDQGRRPFIDLRDLHWPPQAALSTRKRLHILCGDSCMSDLVTYLKVGTTQLVLDVIEAGRSIPGVQLASPARALRELSAAGGADLELELADGTRATALELQRRYLGAVREHFAPALAGEPGEHEPGPARVRDLVRRWERILEGLEVSPSLLYRDLDWVAKLDLMEESDRRSSLPGLEDPQRLERRRKLDLRYHELGGRGYFTQLEEGGRFTRLLDPEDCRAALHRPPPGTRAAVRGHLAATYGGIGGDYRASWSMVTGTRPVPLAVSLPEVLDSTVPPDLPAPPPPGEREGAGLLEYPGLRLYTLPGGTRTSDSYLEGHLPLFLALVILADLGVGLAAPPGWLLPLCGYLVVAPLVAVALVAGLRHLLGQCRLQLSQVLADGIGAVVLNLALLLVCLVLTGHPAPG